MRTRHFAVVLVGMYTLIGITHAPAQKAEARKDRVTSMRLPAIPV